MARKINRNEVYHVICALEDMGHVFNRDISHMSDQVIRRMADGERKAQRERKARREVIAAVKRLERANGKRDCIVCDYAATSVLEITITRRLLDTGDAPSVD